MYKKFSKFMLFACLGVSLFLWGVYGLTTIPASYPTYGYEWGSFTTTYVRNAAHTNSWFPLIIGGALMAWSIHLYRKRKSLEIECLDLILDENDSMRCHLIQAGKGIINSGTRYMGEDGEVHIRWDKPRRPGTWNIDKMLTAEDIRRYMKRT